MPLKVFELIIFLHLLFRYCEDDLIKQGTDSEPEKSHNGTTPR